MKAVINDAVVAESEETIFVEGNYYFPVRSVNKTYLIESDTKTFCPWKGIAFYYHAIINGETITDAAWYYPEPKRKAGHIKGYIAFWPKYIVEENNT